MIFTKRNIALFILTATATLLFTTCKKYPENNLWFKNPEKVVSRGNGNPWILDYYAVNDVDSTRADFLRVWREKGLTLYHEGRNLRTATPRFYCSDIIKIGGWELCDKKKIILFRFAQANVSNNSADLIYLNQRIILLYWGVRFKILKLSKNQFWMVTESDYQGKKYEIHFK